VTALVAFEKSPSERSPTIAPSTKPTTVTGPHTGKRTSTFPSSSEVPPSGRGTKSRSGSVSSFTSHCVSGIAGSQRE
jgi:hypothetical protein